MPEPPAVLDSSGKAAVLRYDVPEFDPWMPTHARSADNLGHIRGKATWSWSTGPLPLASANGTPRPCGHRKRHKINRSVSPAEP